MQVACTFVTQNGFTNGAKGGKQSVSVAANTTASPVSGVSPSYWIRVTVSEQLPLTFLAVLGQQWVTVSSQSTSGVWPSSGGGCIYTLDPTDTDISMNGTTSLTTGCGVYDNSNSNSAISIVGNGPGITASQVNVVGNVSTHSPSQISPAPKTGAPSVTDPFAGMPAPTPAVPCINYTGQSVLSGGTYCNTISLNNGNLTLNPGIYILEQGLDIGGNATLTNNTTGGDGSGGVMLYSNGGSIDFHGNPTATLNAPTTGTYKGVLMWQDKSDNSAVTLKGASSLQLNGALYFPTAALTYNGGTNTTNTTIVTYTLSLVGGSNINSAASTAYTSTGLSGAHLIQ